MKTLIKLLFFLQVLIYTMNSQPIISYTLPDIAAPDMAIYIEIIGPHDVKGNFGSDLFSLNNPNDNVRIEPFNLSDTNKIIFGPLVVSWDGRMISSSIFVKSNVEPNSWDWSQLNQEFRIPFRVYVQGKGYSNTDTIYIVKPYPGMDWSSVAENILGQGQLGKRSRRGAMIFDYLVLGNKEYRVSVNDCDPISNGNQGYLPFTLLVKGELKGGANTTINVSGGSPSPQDAGPGGGGGGGRFCDGTDIGDDGGNGFVAGGPGGRNSSGIPGVNNVFKNYGQSTGTNGSSMNGVMPPPKGQYEASGGATGHPFGLSGEPCFDGNNCEGVGGYGGGSGNKQLNDGGSAGYVDDGFGPFKSKGKSYGNTMIVPVAGGSGGASGNPQGLFTCSGNGGGGGGAISIYARSIDGVSLFANGASGGSQPADGGGGSGGSLLIYSKLPYINFKLSVNGGKAGGNSYYASNGRIRIDALQEVNGDLQSSVNPFRGFAFDTSSNVFRKFTLTGRKEFQKHLQIFIKPQSGVWQHLIDISSEPSSWSQEILLPERDSVYYIIATQNIDNPSKTEYKMEPPAIFSQSAMNILKVMKAPSLACDSILETRQFECGNFPITFKSKLYNNGDADLDVEFQNAKFLLNNQGFTIDYPKGFKKIKPGDSVEIQVSFSPNKKYISKFEDTLIFSHNDIFQKNPFYIVYRVILDTMLISIQEKGKEKPITSTYKGLDTLDLGKICYVNNLEKDFVLQNYSSNIIKITNVRFQNNFYKISSFQPLMSNNEPTNTQDIKISLNVNKYGRIFDTMFVSVAECPGFERKFYVTTFIDSVSLKFTGNSNFGNVNLGVSKISLIKIHNNGSVNAVINDINDLYLLAGNEFKIISITPKLPVSLRPYLDTLFVEIEFTPTQEKSYQDLLVLDTKLDCPRQDRLVLNGRGVVSRIFVSNQLLDFGFGSKCEDKELSFYVKNLPDASTDLIITGRAQILGPDKANFIISQEPGKIPLTLKPGDSTIYYVRYTAIEGNQGIKNAYIEIPTSDFNMPTIRIDLTAEREDLVIDIIPNDTIDIGNIFAGFEATAKLILANAGRLDHYVFDTRINSPNVKVFPLGGWLNKNKENQREFEFKIIETSGGTKEYAVMFIVSNPCYDTLFAIIRANSIPSEATLPNKLDYGILSPCETKTLSFVVENLSKGPFIIKSISGVAGKDANSFRITSKLPSVPDTVWMGTNRSVIVEVDPSTAPDGTLEAYIDVILYINGKEETRRIQLIAERKSGMLVTPKSLSYGDVVVNTTKTLQLRLENNGIWDIHDIVISPPINYPLNYTGTPIPKFDLVIGSNRTIDITFQPTALQDYNDSILIEYQVLNCPTDSIWIYLEGKGIPAKNFTLWLPEITTDPTNENLQIPIYAKLEKAGENLTQFNLDTLEIEFDRSLFYLEKIINKNSNVDYRSTLNQDRRKITLNLRNITIIDKDTILAILQGKAMLGSQSTTALDIVKCIYSQKALVSRIDTIDGKLTINYCSEGGDRLLKYSNNPFLVNIVPNPSNGEITINLSIIENGLYEILIFDNLGRQIEVDKLVLNPKDKSHFEQIYNLHNLPNGTYNIVVKSPTQIYSTNLLIVR